MTGDLAAAVVGGGIAGLAAAVSLRQAGWRVTVLERAPAYGEVGAGVAVTGNAMAALRAIGVDEAVRAAGHEGRAAGFQDQSGRWLMRMPDTRPELRPIVTIWGIHRRRLHSALLAAAAGVELVTGAEVTSVQAGRAGGDRAAVTYQTGAGSRAVEADLVVAADGVRSAVRAQLFPDARPRYSGSTCWRAVVPDTALGDRLVEMWGPGGEFGALRISDGEAYWFGYFRHPEGSSFGDELAAARDRFRAWPPQVQAMLAATSEGQLIRHDVYHLPGGLPRYSRGRVVMIGDAAHAALPTLGQGAGTALEDGVCVGRMIAAPVAAGGGLGPALAAFDQARRPRCRRIARQSVMIARIGADLGGGWRQPVRNGLLRLVPAALAIKIGVPVVHWTPPAAAAS